MFRGDVGVVDGRGAGGGEDIIRDGGGGVCVEHGGHSQGGELLPYSLHLF